MIFRFSVRERLALKPKALPLVEQAKELIRERERRLAEKQQAQTADAAGEKAAQAKRQRHDKPAAPRRCRACPQA
jgi:hypothetical protein